MLIWVLCNFSFWLCALAYVCVCGLFGQCHCTDYHKQKTREMPGVNTTDTNTLRWETETNRLWHLVRGEPIITEWFNHTLSLHAFAFSVFFYFFIYLTYTLHMHVLFIFIIFFRNNPVLIPRADIHTHFLIFLLHNKWLFVCLWSALSKTACFCCAVLQQEGLIWHLLPSDLSELTDQRWWRGWSSPSVSTSSGFIAAAVCPLLARSSFIFCHGFVIGAF